MKPVFPIWFFLIALGVPSISQASEYRVPAPPALVPCESEQKCETNPEKLEQFVSAFFEWYIDSRQSIFNEVRIIASDKRNEFNNIYFSELDRLTERLLSQKYKKLFKIALGSYDGQLSAPYCNDTDSEILTCLFYLPDKWLESVKARVDNINPSVAELSVTYPSSQRSGVTDPGKTVRVRLIPESGWWKIARVEDMR